MSNRKGVSLVLTTLIIVAAAVTISTTLILFTTSFITKSSAIPSMRVTNTNYWINSTANAVWGAASIRNSGDSLLQITDIIVRGNSVPFPDWYIDIDQNRVTLDNSQRQLFYPGNDGSGMLKDSVGSVDTGPNIIDIDLDKSPATTSDRIALSKASGSFFLKSGERAIIYFRVPGGILGSQDIGESASMNITSNDPKAVVQVFVQSV